MNFTNFRETITCFTRTEQLIAEFGESCPREASVKVAELRLPQVPEFRTSAAALPAKLELLRLLNTMAETSKFTGRWQLCWNRQACEIVESFCAELLELIRVGKTKPHKEAEAKARLAELKKTAKHSKLLPRRRQIRFNGGLLKMLEQLHVAHQAIEKAWLQDADLDPKALQGVAAIKEAKRIHERSTRGLRRYLGPFSVQQSRFNDAVTGLFCRLFQMQTELFRCRGRHPGKRADLSAFSKSRLSLHGWAHSSGAFLEVLLAETRELNKLVGELQSQNRSQEIALKSLLASLEHFGKEPSQPGQ